MPRTIKLSRSFYEQFGDEPANELVDVLNSMDATYRAELRDMIELNFEKFDARLERRIAELRSDLRTEFRTELFEAKGELRSEFQELKLGVSSQLQGIRVDMRELKADLIKWMFLFWTGTALANVLLR